MPKQIKKWQCGFCRKSWVNKKRAAGHELLCFYNPKRTPRQFELALWENIPNVLKQVNSYGVPHSTWMEPKEQPFSEFDLRLMAPFTWWPRDKDGDIELGMYFCGDKWIKIPGYKPPEFSPGYCWRDEVVPEEFYNKKPA